MNPKLIPQERENYCVCSILQGIFAKYGLNISQNEIAGNLTPSNNGHIIYDGTIKNFLKSKGFDYAFYWHDETPFNEPDSLLEQISENDGFIAMGIHAYRVLSFVYPEIISEDPKDSGRKTFNLYDLMAQLSKLGGGFGLIKKFD